MKLILKKPNKAIYLDGSHLIKTGTDPGLWYEYYNHLLLSGLDIDNYLPKLIKFEQTNDIHIGQSPKYTIIREYIKAYPFENLTTKQWKSIFQQLKSLVTTLEKNQIKHNDFHLGNIIITSEIQVKIIDYETLIDYRTPSLYAQNIVFTSTKEEQKRMGWSLKFKPGSDLNQIYGELIDQFNLNFPSIKKLIKQNRASEFKYAVKSNPLLSQPQK